FPKTHRLLLYYNMVVFPLSKELNGTRAEFPYTLLEAFEQHETIGIEVHRVGRVIHALALSPRGPVISRKMNIAVEFGMDLGQIDPLRARECLGVERCTANDHHLCCRLGVRQRLLDAVDNATART